MFTFRRIYKAANFFFSFPRLIPKLLDTYRAYAYLLLGIWEKENKSSLWTFTNRDPGYMTWYEKIGDDFSKYGRFGYVFDDGLGQTLGSRIYNNWVTYVLLELIGWRRYSLLTFISFFISITYCLSFILPMVFAVLLTILIMPSPLIHGLIVDKPERIWWAPSMVAILLLLQGHYFMAGIIWSLLAFVNSSTASILLFFIVLPAMARSLDDNTFWLLTLAILPGVIKTSIRLIYAYGTGFTNLMAKEQKKINGPFKLDLKSIIFPAYYILSLMCAVYSTMEPTILFLAIIGLVLWYKNDRPLKYADGSSIITALFTISIVVACYSQNYLALFFAFSIAYITPKWQNQCLNLITRWHEGAKDFWDTDVYPHFKPRAFPRPKKVMDFFKQIPEYTRFVTEADGKPFRNSPMRTFWCWTDGFMPERHLDNVCEIYTRFAEPELTENILEKLSIDHMPAAQIDATLQALGTSCIIVHTDVTKKALENIGYTTLDTVNLEEYLDFCQIFSVKIPILHLLCAPKKRSLIMDDLGNAVDFQLVKSDIIFNVTQGRSYTIAYRFDEQFEAHITGAETPIQSYHPFTDMPTRFMHIEATNSGLCRVHFRPRYLPRLKDWISFGQALLAPIFRNNTKNKA